MHRALQFSILLYQMMVMLSCLAVLCYLNIVFELLTSIFFSMFYYITVYRADYTKPKNPRVILENLLRATRYQPHLLEEERFSWVADYHRSSHEQKSVFW